MKVNDINETLLAEIIEQNGKLQEDLLGMKKAIDGLSEDHTKFANQFSPKLKSNEFEEMIPKKDAEERARFLIRTYVDLQGRYAQLKADYGELQAKTRYWASNQWAKYLFRWLFLKRHLWIWVVYALFTLTIFLSVCNSVLQQRKIVELQETQMKYRFVKATGAAPRVVQFLEDAYEQGNHDQVDYIETVVTDYERALKLKADSIVRSESQKVKRF
jgi:hypothetical protein